jgi:hypothetical protein
MSKMNIRMTVNFSMLMNVVYVAVIPVTIDKRVLRKQMTISIVALLALVRHLASGGVLVAGEFFEQAVPSHLFIAFN